MEAEPFVGYRHQGQSGEAPRNGIRKVRAPPAVWWTRWIALPTSPLDYFGTLAFAQLATHAHVSHRPVRRCGVASAQSAVVLPSLVAALGRVAQSRGGPCGRLACDASGNYGSGFQCPEKTVGACGQGPNAPGEVSLLLLGFGPPARASRRVGRRVSAGALPDRTGGVEWALTSAAGPAASPSGQGAGTSARRGTCPGRTSTGAGCFRPRRRPRAARRPRRRAS